MIRKISTLSIKAIPLRSYAAALLMVIALSASYNPSAEAGPRGIQGGREHAPPPIATLAIPKIGLNEPVWEGVGRSDLERGVGHFPRTAAPGRWGNTVLLGHRTTGPAPFRRLGRLSAGDPLDLRAEGRSLRYRVRSVHIITPRQTSVLEPVPFKPGASPDGRYLSLITCHPKGSDTHRLVVVGEMASPLTGL
ncbi:class E sortase [Spirillospora sp. NPDC047279]|uniref:class E sortase n=1 Tax=Spirillospora sp. NPDC047279 TaxID=3155478 RepID=UPI0033C990CB